MLRLSPSSFLLGVFTLLPAVGHAQVSLYAIAGLANYGFTHLDSSDISFKGDTGGIGGGAFYNFPIESRVTVGIDGRAAYSPGNKGGFLSGAALRVGLVPHHVPLRPFLQVGAGVVHSSYDDIVESFGTFGTETISTSRRSVTSGAAQFVVGLDIRLTDRLDLRAPELGAQAGGGSGVAAQTAFLNAGLVYHLRPR